MRTTSAALLCTIAVVPAAAQIPAVPVSDLIQAKQAVDADKLDDLVGRLGAADFRTREKAGGELLAIGDRALPQLKLVLRSEKDYEVARRIGAIVKQFEADRLAAPRRVTLKVRKVTATDALQRIARQTGYRFQLDHLKRNPEVAKSAYSFDLSDVPFWQAVDAVCNAAGLDVNVNDDAGTLAFTFSDCYNPITAYAGPFRFVATNVNTGKSISLARLSRKELFSPAPEYLSLGIGLTAEPKAQVVGVKGTQLVKAIDDLGNVVTAEAAPPQSQSYYYGYGYRSYGYSLNLSLTRPNKDSTHLKELRARAQIVLLAETRPEVTIRDVLKVKNKKFVGRSTEVELSQVEANNGQATVTVTFRQLNPLNANDYTWVNSINQRVELADANGVKYQPNGWNNTNYSPTSFSLAMNFIAPPGGAKVGPPSTFTLLEWITSTQDVEFTFKDVILP
ncbi:MAG TPA: hypothetical protein VGJ05_20745 [Fimbriiglobus sp.]|jgi:hypothetical protein